MTVKEIIEKSGRTRREIAETVFPDHKFPIRSLKRLENGKQPITVDELLLLCRVCGVSATDVVSNWKTTREDAMLVFVKGPVRAEFRGQKIRIYKNGSLIADETSERLPYSYVHELEETLNKYL